MNGRPFWLETGPEPVFAVLHSSTAGDHAQTAALMLPSFGWDTDGSYRPRRQWATALAESGVPTLRIDLPGSENSVGSPLAPNRFQSWIDATVAAAQWLRHRTTCDRLVAIGFGLGGVVAYVATAQADAIDDLILWAVPATGRAYVREQRVFAAMVAERLGVANETAREDGSVGIAGHVMSAETVAAMGATKLTEIPLEAPERRRVLLVGRDAHGVDVKLQRHLEETGASVTILDADDYHCLVSPPELGQSPAKTIAASIRWILDAATDGPDPIEHATVEVPRVVEAVEFEYNGVRIREQISEFESSDGRLVGIIGEPAAGVRAPYCLVTFNSGGLRHTGPSRLFVEMARRAAAMGVPTARFDFPGLGDSDGLPIRSFERRAEHDDVSLATFWEICRHLRELGVADSFVPVGLSLGGYLSVRAVLSEQRLAGAEERLAGAISLNPTAFTWTEKQRQRLVREIVAFAGREAIEDAAPTPVRTPGPLRALTERLLQIRQVLDAEARKRLARIDFLWRLEHRVEFAEVSRVLDQLVHLDARLFLIFSEHEALLRMLAQPRMAAKLRDLNNVRIEQLPTNDHLLTPLWIQEIVLNQVSDALAGLAQDGERHQNRGKLPPTSVEEVGTDV